MKCYYEELGVERDANDAEVKTAYRKLALRWHPDKNPNNIEAAKEQFQLIQQAYDVLSDRQERAWYDNHREQILRGKNSDYEDNCLDLFQYFTVSCYKGYGDDAKGFYSVYTEVFEKIAAEDAEFMDDEEEVEHIPKFGNSKSSYEDVVGPFYAYWQSYCTKKTYTWLCPYDVQEIKDRRVLREVEKELKKIVQKAKKERNEEVRNLVSFIRKRDKRVQNYKEMLEERAALNRQKQEQKRMEQIQQRKKDLEEIRKNRADTLNNAYEAQLKQLEQEYSDQSSYEETESDIEDEDDDLLIDGITDLEIEEDDEVEEEIYVHDLYCVACNKAFKNEKAYANHETSRKHRDNVEVLKQEMLEEDHDIFTELEEEDNLEENDKVLNEDIIGLHDCLSESDVDPGLASKTAPDNEEQPMQTKKGKKAKKSNKSKTKTIQNISNSGDEEPSATLPNLEVSNEGDNDWSCSKKKNSNKKAKNKQGKINASETKANNKTSTEATAKVEHPATPPSIAAPSTVNNVNEALIHKCVTCNNTFESKNKLFAHLKEMNHGVYIPKSSSAASNVNEALTHKCVTCNNTFDSKNKLYAHLKLMNHGVYIPKNKPTQAETGKKPKSKRK